MKIALYAGSFDPFTNGHLDILSGALCIADQVIIAIGVHPQKKSLFTFHERASMIETAISATFGANVKHVTIQSFDELVVNAALSANATLLVRGLRDGTDFDYEMQMAGMNRAMAPDLQTVFIPSTPNARSITATLVRQIAAMGGDVTAFVPANIADALSHKFKSQ